MEVRARFADVGLRQNSGGGAALVHGYNTQTQIRQSQRFSFLVIQQPDRHCWNSETVEVVSRWCCLFPLFGKDNLSGKGKGGNEGQWAGSDHTQALAQSYPV